MKKETIASERLDKQARNKYATNFNSSSYGCSLMTARVMIVAWELG
jgi:hypothetical protein